MAEFTTSEQALRWHAMSSVRGEVLRRVGPLADDAEDCLHDAMLRAASRPELDLESGRLVSFLVQATKWRAIDRARSREAAIRVSMRASRLPADAFSPEDVATGRALANTLQRAVLDLPVREREVIGHRVAGFDAAETARRLGISYKAQEGALTRARRKLRVAMGVTGAVLAGLVRNRLRSPAKTFLGASLTAVALVTMSWNGVVGHNGSRSHGERHGHAISVVRAGSGSQRVAGVRDVVLSHIPRRSGSEATSPASTPANQSPLVSRSDTGIHAPAPPVMHHVIPDPRRLAACLAARFLPPTASCL